MLHSLFCTHEMQDVRSKMWENVSPSTEFSTRLNFRTQGLWYNQRNTSIRILLRQLRPKATTSLKTVASVYHCNIALDREDGQKDSSLFTASRRRLSAYIKANSALPSSISQRDISVSLSCKDIIISLSVVIYTRQAWEAILIRTPMVPALLQGVPEGYCLWNWITITFRLF